MLWPARKWVRWLLAGFAALLLAVAARGHLARDHRGGAAARGDVRRVGRQGDDPRRGRERTADRPAHRGRGRDRASARHDPHHGLRGGLRAARDPRRPHLRRGRDDRARRPSRCTRRRARHARRRSCPAGSRSLLDDAAVASLLIVAPRGTETRFRDIRGSARITHSSIEFKGGHVRSTGWAVAGAGGTLFAREPLALDVTTAWSLTDDDRVAGIARATGDLERLLVDARVAAPATVRVQAEVRDLADAADVAGRGRDRVARPRAVDRKSARGPARGVARDRGRSPPLCRARHGPRRGPARGRRPGRHARAAMRARS